MVEETIKSIKETEKQAEELVKQAEEKMPGGNPLIMHRRKRRR